MVLPADRRGLVQKGCKMIADLWYTVTHEPLSAVVLALAELQQAALELGDDAPVEGELLDLANLALALKCPELWREGTNYEHR